MEQHEQIHKNLRQIFLNNLIGGIAWAFGATIGFSIIIALLGLLLKNVNFIPVFGNFISDLINFIISKNSNLLIK